MTDEQRKKQYQDKANEQLREWVKGNPIHNPYTPIAEMEGGECCPDFSCCNGDLAPLEVREAFKKAHDEGDVATVHKMLADFMDAMLEKNGHRVVSSADVVADVKGDLKGGSNAD
jgi:hypothetical protein